MNVKASQSVPTFEAMQQQQQPQNPRKKPSRSQSQPTLNRKPGGLRTKKTLIKQISHAFSHLSFLYDEMDTASTHSKQTSYSPRKSQTDHEDSLLESGDKADDDDCDLAGAHHASAAFSPEALVRSQTGRLVYPRLITVTERTLSAPTLCAYSYSLAVHPP